MPALKKPTNTLLKNSVGGVASTTSGSSSSTMNMASTTTPMPRKMSNSNAPSTGTILINSVPQNSMENAPKRTVQMLSAPPQPQTASPSNTTTQAKRGRKKKSDTSVKKELFINTETKPEAPTEPVTSSIIHNNSTTPTKLVCPSTPTRKKKNRPTFAVAKIKRIIQSDEEIGKISAVVPILISRALELFIQDLVVTSSKITKKKNAGTVTTAHLKETIEAEERFDFLKNKVKNIQLLSTSNDAVMSDDDESTGKKGKKKKSKKSKEDVESDEDDESSDSNPNSESNSLPISNAELPVATASSNSAPVTSQPEQVKQESTSQSFYNPYQTPQLPTSQAQYSQSSPQPGYPPQQQYSQYYPPQHHAAQHYQYPPQQQYSQHPYPPQQYPPSQYPHSSSQPGYPQPYGYYPQQ